MLLALKNSKFMKSTICPNSSTEAKNQGFLTCQNAETASIKEVDTAGTSAHTTYGENVEPKDLI